jgi:hypothetical protein
LPSPRSAAAAPEAEKPENLKEWWKVSSEKSTEAEATSLVVEETPPGSEATSPVVEEASSASESTSPVVEETPSASEAEAGGGSSGV